MNTRTCDVCGTTGSLASQWWFIQIGKSEPNQFVHAKHWCTDCMKAVEEFLTQLGS